MRRFLPIRRRMILRAAAWLAWFLAFLAVGLSWGLASPVGSSPDDGYHLTSIWCANPTSDPKCEGVRYDWNEVVVTVPGKVGDPECIRTASGRCLDALPARIQTSRVNDGQYPGGFYALLNPFASDDVERSVITIRVVNLLLGVGLLALVSLVAGIKWRRVMATTMFATSVPLAIFIVASTNPSAWALAAVPATFFALAAAYTVPSRTRRIVLAALALVSTILAIAARGDSALYCCLVVGAAFVAFAQARWRHWPTYLASFLIMCLGAAGFLMSRQTGLDQEANPGGLSLLIGNIFDFPYLFFGSFGFMSARGALGWFDIPLPHSVPFFALGAFALVVFRTVWRAGSRRHLAIAILAAAYVFMPLYLSQVRGVDFSGFVQSRYVLPLLTVMVGLMASSRVLRRPQAVTLAIFLFLGHSAALYATLRRHTMGIPMGNAWLGRVQKWWWANPVISPRVDWLLGTLAFGLVLIPLVSLHHRLASPASPGVRPTLIPAYVLALLPWLRKRAEGSSAATAVVAGPTAAVATAQPDSGQEAEITGRHDSAATPAGKSNLNVTDEGDKEVTR